jgi:hypothetical protein
MAKTPDQLREEAQAYRGLANELGGAVLSEALHENAKQLERLASDLERELAGLFPSPGPTST